MALPVRHCDQLHNVGVHRTPLGKNIVTILGYTCSRQRPMVVSSSVLSQKQVFLIGGHLTAEEDLGQQSVFRRGKERVFIILSEFQDRISHPQKVFSQSVIPL